MYNNDFLRGGDLRILGVFLGGGFLGAVCRDLRKCWWVVDFFCLFLLTETEVVVYVSIGRNIHHGRLVFAVFFCGGCNYSGVLR